MFRTTDDIVQSLLSAETENGSISPLAARAIAALARPGFWLETRAEAHEDDIAPGVTRIGGRPDLPRGMAWPVRPAYADAARRAARYRDEHGRTLRSPPDWLAKDQIPGVLEDYRRREEAVSGPFPYSFIAQADLAEMHAAGRLDPDMPHEGRLSLFFDAVEGPWGFDPADDAGALLVYDAAPSASLQRVEFPQKLAAFGVFTRFGALSCQTHACLMPVPPQSPSFDALALGQAVMDGYWSWWNDGSRMYSSEGGKDWKCHRVSGWPTPVQGDMQTECAIVAAGYSAGGSDSWRTARAAGADRGAEDWLLLLQIGTDEKAGMMWGDSGQLYVWIRREDLRARRFDRARLKLQSY